MDFEKRIEAFRKLLFIGYVRTDKVFEEDWQDEATELALEIKLKSTEDNIGNKISKYLESKFIDDTVTDFDNLGLKMANIINPKLK